MVFFLCLAVPAQCFTLSNFENPESIAVDPEDGSYYVSNIKGSVSEKDGNGYISKISPNGNIVIQQFIGGKAGEVWLNAPKGLAILKTNIFVADIDSVKVFNKITGKPVTTIDFSKWKAQFLNDVALDGEKWLYVSDTMANRIFRIDLQNNNRPELYKASPELGAPNGLIVNPKTGHLMAVTWEKGQIIEMDGERRVHVLKKGLQTLDGVTLDDSGNLYVSSFEKGEIYKITHYGRGAVSTVLSGLTSPADISFDRRKNEILIPSLKGNTVTTFTERKNTK
jgi:DNA-binding beta-propeller fold protein YncE